MNQREPARPQTQGKPDQLRATRELLEEAGVPSDDDSARKNASEVELADNELSQHSVQPSAGVLHNLQGTSGQPATPPAEHNQRDSGADVLLP